MTVNLLRRARVKPEKALPPAERERVVKYVASAVPEKHKIATQRALLGQVARSTAIRIKCLQCCNYEREEVRGCTVTTCALHPVRPYQVKNHTTDVTADADEHEHPEA